MLLLLQVISYGLTLWLGIYLLARDWHAPHLRWAGLGLLAYAVVVAGSILHPHAPSDATAETILRLTLPAIIFPASLWYLSLLHLFEQPLRHWDKWMVGVATAIYGLGASTSFMFDYEQGVARQGYALLGLGLGLAILLTVRQWQQQKHPRTLSLLLVAIIFFGLGIGLIVLALAWLPYEWTLLAITADLLIFGYCVAVLDAFEQGETIRPSMVRAFDISLASVLIFGGQIGLVMNFSTGITFPMLVLLLTIIASAIGVQLLATPLAHWIDRMAFARQPLLQAELATLRTEADILPKRANMPDILTLDEAEFIRLTRRALRDYTNLPKLATNPLTNLPIVDSRLATPNPSLLERAAELKLVLTESIEALKPRDEGASGIGDTWRHYNALYYPYVVGMRPYNRRPQDAYDGDEQMIWEWFRQQVPERTLYNWQTAATRLIALHLRDWHSNGN